MKRIGLLDIFALIVLLSLALGAHSLAGDPGVGWHLLNGKLIFAHGAVPQVDLFLLREQPQPWVANQWLSDVIVWLSYSYGGWAVLHTLVIVIFLAAFFGILAPMVKRDCGNFLCAFFVLLLVLLAASVQLFIRPVIFSFLLFALSYRIVRSWLFAEPWPGKTSIWTLPLLFAVWANLHPAFPLGGMVLIAAVVHLLWIGDRTKALTGVVVGILSLAATLINPYGIRLYSAGAGLVGDSYFMNLNVEWYSTDSHMVLFAGFTAIICAVLLFSARADSRLQLFDRVLLLLFLVMASTFRRYIPFCAIVAAAPLSALMGASVIKTKSALRTAILSLSAKEQRSSSFLYTGIAALVLMLMCSLGFSPAGRLSPQAIGIDAIQPAAASRALGRELDQFTGSPRVFHSPDWGGYLTFSHWPALKTFIDDRNLLNGKDYYEAFFIISQARPGWEERLAKGRFQYALLRPDMPLNTVLAQSQDWETIHQDDSAVLLKRKAESPTDPSR